MRCDDVDAPRQAIARNAGMSLCNCAGARAPSILLSGSRFFALFKGRAVVVVVVIVVVVVVFVTAVGAIVSAFTAYPPLKSTRRIDRL